MSLLTLPLAVCTLSLNSLYVCALDISTDIVRPNNNYKWLVPVVTRQIINDVFPISPTLANPSGDSVSANILYSIQETLTLILEISPTYNKQQQ